MDQLSGEAGGMSSDGCLSGELCPGREGGDAEVGTQRGGAKGAKFLVDKELGLGGI